MTALPRFDADRKRWHDRADKLDKCLMEIQVLKSRLDEQELIISALTTEGRLLRLRKIEEEAQIR